MRESFAFWRGTQRAGESLSPRLVLSVWRLAAGLSWDDRRNPHRCKGTKMRDTITESDMRKVEPREFRFTPSRDVKIAPRGWHDESGYTHVANQADILSAVRKATK